MQKGVFCEGVSKLNFKIICFLLFVYQINIFYITLQDGMWGREVIIPAFYMGTPVFKLPHRDQRT
jgi:hypothetical protein